MEVDVDGVLVVDKPPGPTSHDVVALVRRAIGVRRVGHVGTLDPLASGVLPLVVGRATRLARFLSSSDKEYVADVAIGFVSGTFDAEGPLTRCSGAGVELVSNAAALESVLAEFRGSYLQLPPPHSAKKVGGTPAYKLARRNTPVELQRVPVSVHELEALAVEQDVLRLRIVCSAGFYVRRLAHDLGERLGCGAYLAALRRTRVGTFDEADAVRLDMLVADDFDPAARLVPLDRLLPDLPAVVVSEEGARRVRHGNAVGPAHLTGTLNVSRKVDTPQDSSGVSSFRETLSVPIRLLDGGGALLAIAEARPGGLLHPAIVLV